MNLICDSFSVRVLIKILSFSSRFYVRRKNERIIERLTYQINAHAGNLF